MTSAQAQAIARAVTLGWRFNATIGKFKHPDSSAVYLPTVRWGLYALEDHPKPFRCTPASIHAEHMADMAACGVAV
jgi:hypothetical protein